MDTLFRLVNLQSSDQHSYNSSRTSSSSRSSSKQNYSNSTTNNNSNYYSHSTNNQYYFQEECNTNQHYYYMDEDFSSSSSSKQHFHAYSQSNTNTNPSSSTTPILTPSQTPPPSSLSSTAQGHALFEPSDFSYPPDLSLDYFSSPTSSSSSSSRKWATPLLVECAQAVATRDSQRVQQLMWMLNELSSPYGETDQKLASYFLQGLFARLTSSGPKTLHTLMSASDHNTSFESTRRTALKFQELNPWASFGHVAANGAILDSFLEVGVSGSISGPQKFHILDLSNTYCTQWPTLLEALATRSCDDTPHLSLTTVIPSSGSSSGPQRVMREIGQRMEKFARLMGVPFKFNVVHHNGDLCELDLERLDLSEGGTVTAIAVNFISTLHGVSSVGRRREGFLNKIRRLEPRIVTIVEEEADLIEDGGDEAGFMKVFKEGLRFFSAYIDSLEESFPTTSNERLALEREVGRAVVDLVACPKEGSRERRETALSWTTKMRASGYSSVGLSEDVVDDMRSLLRRYREGWSMREAGDESTNQFGFFLSWKEQPVVWASAWRP